VCVDETVIENLLGLAAAMISPARLVIFLLGVSPLIFNL